MDGWAFMVARGWGWDRVPPRWEPREQDAGDHKGPPHRPSSTLAPTEYPTPFREVDTSWTTLAVTPALQTETSIFLSRFFTGSSAIGRFQLSPGFCAADMVDRKTCQTRWRRVITDKEKGYRVT